MKITDSALGKTINTFIVTDGTTDDIKTETIYPPLAMIFVPVSDSADVAVPYKLYLTDENGIIHPVV